MSTDTLIVVLAYATIPVYVFGLLGLIYYLARHQFQLSFSQEIKRAGKSFVKKKLHKKQHAYPPVVYLCTGLFLALLVMLAFILEKEKQPWTHNGAHKRSSH